MKPYQQPLDVLIAQLKTNATQGLSSAQVQERLQRYGFNELPEVSRKTLFSIFLNQFKSPLIYILLVAAVIIFFIGDNRLDAFIVSGVLLFNAVVGTIQEGRAKNIIEALKHFLTTTSVVIRDNDQHIVQDKEIVVGDLIVLQAGQRVPADARIIEAYNLYVDESVLTGESAPVHKFTEAITQEVPISDQHTMVFKGTFVVTGTGKAVVVATGPKTEIGKIQKSIEEIKTEIPLKKELDRLSYWILIFIFCMCIGLFIFGLLVGRPFRELVVMLTALFVCVIPEGLPVVLTLVLVSGAFRMAKRNVLVKNLQGVEALGRTDVIVLDKTGTLTRNEMMVSIVIAHGKRYQISGEGYHTRGTVILESKQLANPTQDEVLKQIGIAATLLNSSEIEFNKKLQLFDIKGDPTEAALLIFGKKLGLAHTALEKEYTKVCEIPFDSDLKYHAAFYQKAGQPDPIITFIAGAPEALIKRAANVPELFKTALQQMLAQGLRVVAIGKKEIPAHVFKADSPQSENKLPKCAHLIEHDIELLGLCGIQDAIRPEVRDIIMQARDAGLSIVMATGDHKETARYVAQAVGILREGDEIIDGSEFKRMSDKEVLARLSKITVFARVVPNDKVRIIQLFHKQDKIVAMTGDGVNDVPSLVVADLGIAMGRIGTEVAKQAADLVLLDDSFTSIVHAIEQGRHIFYTIRRVILYFFSTNMAELLIVLFALFANLPLPLTAAQILWLNLVTDGFLDMGLAMESEEEGLLQATWLKRKLHLVDLSIFAKTLYFAIPMAIGSLLVFWWYLQQGATLLHARTMALVTMALFQWFNAWNCRSERYSILHSGILSNRWFLLAAGFVFTLQIVLTTVPFFRYIFKTDYLSLHDWVVILCVTFPIVLIEEIRKRLQPLVD